jgi:hypothetical protein
LSTPDNSETAKSDDKGREGPAGDGSQEQEKPSTSAPAKIKPWLAVAVLLLAAAAILTIVILELESIRGALEGSQQPPLTTSKFAAPKEGTWRFIVSGDSRNCGDVVMPAIAAHGVARYQPSFYWHLGDLRAIYKVDEDMAAADLNQGRYLGCETYLKRAWPDFIENQIAPFGSLPFYVGIGNHEVILPKGGSENSVSPEVKGSLFTAQFADFLLAPALKAQRLKDRDCDNPAGTAGRANASGNLDCLVLPRNYYHWTQGGVDFIYLDNATNVFGRKQLDWFNKRIDDDTKPEAHIQSVVVGMHEALPGSISANHAMCDKTNKDVQYPRADSCREGEEVYGRLLSLQQRFRDKHVYTLASHSHYYMAGIFATRPEAEHLPGWIVGTAGAVRYPVPEDGTSKSDGYKVDVYGYLLGSVDQNGRITFEFQELAQKDVPPSVVRRYGPLFVDWCFAHNSHHIDPQPQENTNRCVAPAEPR